MNCYGSILWDPEICSLVRYLEFSGVSSRGVQMAHRNINSKILSDGTKFKCNYVSWIYRIFHTIRRTPPHKTGGWKVCVSYGAKKTDYIFLFSSPKKLVRLMERCVLWSEKYDTFKKYSVKGCSLKSVFQT